MNKDFLNILREIRGTAAPGEVATDGIWYELTAADKNGNAGVYGDILAKYGVVTESAGTFDQAVAILENLNVVVSTLPAGSAATSALINGVWELGIPQGTAGIDGVDGSTPEVQITYANGQLKQIVTVDSVEVVNQVLLDLDTLVDTVVNANIAVQDTLDAKQIVLDKQVEVNTTITGFDTKVATEKSAIEALTETNKTELNDLTNVLKADINTHTTAEIGIFDTNAADRFSEYDANHTVKVAEYNANDTIKVAQYNANHLDKTNILNDQYADRIVDMLNTKRLVGMVDNYTVETTTQMITFISTDSSDYMYYVNGVQLVLNTDYTVFDNTTIELASPVNPGDVVIQINAKLLSDVMVYDGVVFDDVIGVANGIAQLDANGTIPSSQLPSYVDDVLEYATYADLPTTGEADKIYVVVADETSNGDTSSYRWTGSVFAMVSNTLNAADIKSLYESNTNTNEFTDAEKVKVGYVSVTQAVDLDTIESDTALNNAHRVSDGSDHTFINQDVTTTGTPTFASVQLSGGTGTQGLLSWNTDEETADLVLDGAVLQIGQEFVVNVRNNTGVDIANGTPLMLTGTLGASGRITAAPMDGTNAAYARYIVGIATTDILNGADGKATVFGKVRGVDTTGTPYGETWVDGDIIYVSPTTAGALTNVTPAYNEIRMPVAAVINAAGNGVLMVRALPVNYNDLSDRVAYELGLDRTRLDTIEANKVDKVTSTDNAVVRFSGANGQVQNSGVTIDDTNSIYGLKELRLLDGSNGGLLINYNKTSVNYYDANTHNFRTGGGFTKMSIDSSGNVGIGTSTPTTKLDVVGNASFDGNINIENSSGWGSIELGGSLGGFIDLKSPFSDDKDFRLRGGYGDVFSILTSDNTEALNINQAGNTGIGTTSPTQKLDVVGNIAVSGTVDGRDVAADGVVLDDLGTLADFNAAIEF